MSEEGTRISLDNLKKDEAENLLNSPRSLEVCQSEGVDPKSLLYKPYTAFTAPGKPLVVQQQEYEQYEVTRKSLLAKLRHARWSIIKNEQKALEKSMNQSPPNKDSIQDTTVIPQLQPQYKILKKQYSEDDKAREREFVRISSSLEGQAKMLDWQRKIEENFNEDENKRMLKEIELHKEKKKQKDERDKEHEKQLFERRKQLDEERRIAYDKMIMEINSNIKQQKKEEEKIHKLQELQKKRKEAHKNRKLLYTASVDQIHKIKKQRQQEHDGKIEEKREKINMKVRNIAINSRERRKIMESRHRMALSNVEQEKEERLNSILRRLQEEDMKSTKMFETMTSGFQKSPCDKNVQIERVKESAEKRKKEKLDDMISKMEQGKKRLEEQEKKSEERLLIARMQREIKMKFKNENVERQKKKEEIRKKKLREQQKEQEQKLLTFVEGKEALFGQSQYIKFTKDLRRYNIKNEIEGSKSKCLTIDKLLDINERYKPIRLNSSAQLKPQEVQKLISRMMSRPSLNSSVSQHHRQIQSVEHSAL